MGKQRPCGRRVRWNPAAAYAGKRRASQDFSPVEVAVYPKGKQ